MEPWASVRAPALLRPLPVCLTHVGQQGGAGLGLRHSPVSPLSSQLASASGVSLVQASPILSRPPPWGVGQTEAVPSRFSQSGPRTHLSRPGPRR